MLQELRFLKYKNTRNTPNFWPGIYFISSLVLTRLLTFAAFPNPSQQPDTGSYVSNKAWDFHLVSLLGNSERGWPTTLLFALFPSPVSKMFGMMLISVISWGVFYFCSSAFFSSRKKLWIFSILLSLLANSPEVLQWDTVLLAESFLLSNTVLMLGLVLFSMRNPGKFYLILIALGFSIILVLQKSVNIIFVVAVLSILFMIAYKHISKLKLIIFIILSLSALTYSGFVGMNNDRAWGGISYSTKAILWHFGGQAPDAVDFKKYLSDDPTIPKCVSKDIPFNDIGVGIDRIYKNCLNGPNYIRTRLKNDFINFVIKNPKDMLKLTSLGFGAATTDSANHYGKAVSLFPQVFSEIYFGTVNPDHRFSKVENQVSGFNLLNSGEPMWLFTPFFAWVICGGIGSFLLTRRKIFKGIGISLIAMEVSFLVSMIFTFILLPSEWVRESFHFVAPSFAISLFAILMAINLDESNLNLPHGN
jgi:hypothetical protein